MKGPQDGKDPRSCEKLLVLNRSGRIGLTLDRAAVKSYSLDFNQSHMIEVYKMLNGLIWRVSKVQLTNYRGWEFLGGILKSC